MAKTFSCPTCGAPLDYDGGTDYTISCPFCQNSVIVPEELRIKPPLYPAAPSYPGAPLYPAVPPAPQRNPVDAEIYRLVWEGKKIEAIKIHRTAYNTSLVDAKNAVEHIEAQMRLQAASSGTPMPNRIIISPQRQKVVKILVILSVIVVFLTTIGPLFILPFVIALMAIAQSSSLVNTVPVMITELEPIPTPGFTSPLLTFGSEGIGAGMFTDARSIAVDPEGNIYIAEYSGGRVQAFDSTGKFLIQWNVGDQYIRKLAADRQGNVYVVSGIINRYDGKSGNLLGQLTYSDKSHKNTSFEDLAIALDGTLITAWGGVTDDVVRFDTQGKTVLSVIEAVVSGQTGESELKMLIATNSTGDIYVLGIFNNAVFKYSAEGKFITRFGSQGDKPGQFQSPDSIAVDSQGRIFIGDGRSIHVYDPSGQYLDSFDVDGIVSGMVFNDQDELLVIARTKVIKLELNK